MRYESIVVMRRSAARRCMRIPMLEYGGTCNLHCHKRQRVAPDLIQHTQPATDRRWERLPPARKLAPLTTRSNSQNVCIGSRAPSRRTVQQNGQDKTTKASHPERLIIELIVASTSSINRAFGRLISKQNVDPSQRLP